MCAWHDRVGDLTLFEALTGGVFDVKTGNIAGNLTNIFQKSQMPGGLPGGGWAVLELTGTLFGVRNGSENKACLWIISPLKASK